MNTTTTLTAMNQILNEFRLFYKLPDDDNFYHITCKLISQGPETENPMDDTYDYEFFYQNYHVTCKLVSHSFVMNILNKEIYGRDFDMSDLKRKSLLTSNQKINLELSLKKNFLFLQYQILKSNTRVTFHSETFVTIPQRNMNVNASENQAAVIQPIQNHQSTSQAEFGLFYQPPNDNNFYHVTCKEILQQLCDDDYDYEFFCESSNARYHVTCKLLSYSLIVNILNKEIYGIDFDVNDLDQDYISLTSHQKLNLELNLKQYLLFYI
ncbi:unnamed protein product [Rhizophagus irregularis]|nr:unnamed protein product [Rhizophagus irregularis]CAB5368962.1 unnamed protein product [Rhizophagus irregularis]